MRVLLLMDGRVIANSPSRIEPVSTAFTEADSRIEKIPETGCWIWMRSINPDGYAQGSKHRDFYANRFGPIPKGMVLDHLCRVRCCVNPDHFRACTPRENMMAPGCLSPFKAYAVRPCCPKCGGPWSIRKSSQLTSTRRETFFRQCVPCNRSAERVRRNARRKAQREMGAN